VADHFENQFGTAGAAAHQVIHAGNSSGCVQRLLILFRRAVDVVKTRCTKTDSGPYISYALCAANAQQRAHTVIMSLPAAESTCMQLMSMS
jgi:hypothetical protein